MIRVCFALIASSLLVEVADAVEVRKLEKIYFKDANGDVLESTMALLISNIPVYLYIGNTVNGYDYMLGLSDQGLFFSSSDCTGSPFLHVFLNQQNNLFMTRTYELFGTVGKSRAVTLRSYSGRDECRKIAPQPDALVKEARSLVNIDTLLHYKRPFRLFYGTSPLNR